MIQALFTGKLRSRFFADVALLDGRIDPTWQVACGYICLASSIGWGLNFFLVLIANPANLGALFASPVIATISYLGFAHMRAGGNMRRIVDGLLLIHLIVIGAMSYGNSGVVAPSVGVLPMIAGVSILFQRGRMRWATLTLGAFIVILSLACAMGLAGTPTTYQPHIHSAVTFIVILLSAVSFAGLAWIANISRDFAVTQMRAANDLVLDNAARSRIALEAARVGLWDVPNLDEQTFHVSESFQTVTGYSAEEFNTVWRNIEQFVHADDAGQFREAFAAARTRMSRLRVDFRLNTRTRGYRWFSVRARYIANPDGTLRLSGSLQDINFIKIAEDALRKGRDQARAADKAKSDFIATMSHEVRTPLNAIMGAVEVLKRGAPEEEASELVNLIDDAGRGLLAIVSDLLDVSKIDAGKLEIAASPTDLRSLVTRTADVWKPQAHDKGLTLEVDCKNADAGLLMVDGGRVRQILGNLLSNAIKFTDTGTVRVVLSTYEQPGGGVEVSLGVIDSGSGVPDAVAEIIFGPFEQSPGNESRGGTGLGLFISRRLARLMGGDLTLEPARRQGAHFRLSLPVVRAAVGIEEADAPSADPLWGGRQVLCIDDNEKNRRILELLLSKFGMDVTLCASGAEGLDTCGVHDFDLILMDIVMPDMDGIETLRALRADPDGRNRRTPAIALTARLSDGDLATYGAAGFCGVASKPINVSELAQTISHALAQASI